MALNGIAATVKEKILGEHSWPKKYLLLILDASIILPISYKRCIVFFFKPKEVLAEFSALPRQQRFIHAMSAYVFSVAVLLFLSKQIPFLFPHYKPHTYPLPPQVALWIKTVKGGGFLLGDYFILIGYLTAILSSSTLLVGLLSVVFKIKDRWEVLFFSLYTYASCIFLLTITDFILVVIDNRTLLDISVPYSGFRVFWLVAMPIGYYSYFLKEAEVRRLTKYLLIALITLLALAIVTTCLTLFIFTCAGLDISTVMQ